MRGRGRGGGRAARRAAAGVQCSQGPACRLWSHAPAVSVATTEMLPAMPLVWPSRSRSVLVALATWRGRVGRVGSVGRVGGS